MPMRAITPVAGGLAGFVGTLFGANAGMFFAIYLDLLKFVKVEFRATVAAILFGLGIMRGAGYVSVGAYDRNALIVCAAAHGDRHLGRQPHHANLDQPKFKRLVAAILIASGVPLMLR
jgi:uncharacterized membrane protein YfcA